MKKILLVGSFILSLVALGKDLEMKKIGHYQGAPVAKGGPIDMLDYYNGTLFVANGTKTDEQKPSLDIVNIKGLKNGDKEFKLTKRVDIEKLVPSIGEVGDITCVKVSPDGKYIAMSVVGTPHTDRGNVVITDITGKYIAHYQVGSLPDNLQITPDGKKILVGNEGEPDENLKVDPEGTVSIINLSAGLTKGKVKEVKVENSLITGELKIALDEYIAAAPHKPTYSQALEPEYIAIDKKGEFAYVAFQEESAIGKLDIKNEKFLWVKSMGYKDHSKPENAMVIGKGSDKFVTADVWGMYQPDGMALVEQSGGTFIITGNEGDGREYKALKEDKYTIGQLEKEGYKINIPVTEEMRNLKVSQYRGKNDKGEFDKLYSFGARSFSILKVENDGIKMIYDSGKDFEEITKRELPQYFNADNKDNKPYGRNGAKGPEPEDVTVGVVDGRTYAFIGLERVGGVVTYDITDINKPVYSGYFISRDFSDKIKGDVGIEGLKFVSAENSPTGKALLLAAHEISNSIAIIELEIKK